VARRDRERLRLAIAQALLSASRPLMLADSPLIEEPAVIRLARSRYPDSVVGPELALGDLAREAGERVLSRLGQEPRLTRERAVLETVLAGGSVRSAAQALGVSREHLSNTAWRSCTGWALEAFAELCAASGHTGSQEAARRRRAPLMSLPKLN
jgi:hypothetical protein